MAPKKTGFTDWGTSPCKMRLVNAVSARNRILPPSSAEELVRSRRCCGRIPSGPPADPRGNEQKQLPPPLSLEEGQTPQVEVVMECVTLGVDLDAFPEEN